MASVVAVIVSSFQISFVDVGVLFSAAFVGMTVGSVFFGWLSEIIGRKSVVVWTVGVFGALSIAAAFARSFDGLVAIRLIQGLALGGEVPVVAVLYSEGLPGASRGMSYFYGQNVLFTLGIVVAPLVGLACIAMFGPEMGWRALFGFGGLAIVVAIIQMYFIPESARWLANKGRIREADAVVVQFEASARAKGQELAPPKVLLRADQKHTRLAELFQGIYLMRTLLVWVQFFATFFVLYSIVVWVPTLYVRVGGLPASSALGLSVLFGVILLLTVFIWGAITDPIGRKIGFSAGYGFSIVGFAIGIYCVDALGKTGWPVLLAVSLIAGIGLNYNSSLCYLYSAELFPTRMRAWSTSIGAASARIASFVASTAIGWMLSVGLGIGGVFMLLGAVSLIGLVVTVILGIETSNRVLEEVSA